MSNIDLKELLKTLDVDSGIKSRAQSNWTSADTRKLLKTSLNTGFTDQLELLVKNLNGLGMNVKPNYDPSTNTIKLDIIDQKSGKQSQKPLKIALSNKNGQRNVGGRMIRNDWQAYLGSNGNTRITDSVTYELMQINQKLAIGQDSAVLRAAQKREVDALVNGMKRLQKSVNAQVTVQSKRAQKEIEADMRDFAKRSASRMAMDSGVMSIAPIVNAITKNRDGFFGKKMYHSMKGQSPAERRATIDKDVHDIIGALMSSRGKNQKTVMDSLARKYSARYGSDVEKILNTVASLTNYGLEATNVSNGGYAGGRIGTVTSGQAGSYFSVKSNVHYRQQGNFNPKQQKVGSNAIVKKVTSFNPLASARERARGFTGDKAEEKLMRYIEVSRDNYQKAQQAYIAHQIESEYKKMLSGQKGSNLSSAEKQAIRQQAESKVRNLAKNVLPTIGEDSYGLSAAGRRFLDDYFEKNMTIPVERILSVQKKAKAKGQLISEEEAARRIVAAKAARSLGVSSKRARKMVGKDSFLKDLEASSDNAYNYTYHLNRNFKSGSKLLGRMGDRATSVDAPEEMIVAAALAAGIDPSEIGEFATGGASLNTYKKGSLKIGGMRLQRKVNARNFEEWFSPRIHALASKASSMGKATNFANDFNGILQSALGPRYRKVLGKGNEFFTANSKLNTITRVYDGGILDLLTAAYGTSPSKAKKEALTNIMSGFGNSMLTNSAYGYVNKTGTPFFKALEDGGWDINRAMDNRIVLASAFNAIAKDTYGHPSARGSVLLDRRARYALRRDIEEAASSGTSLDLYRSAIAAQEGNTDLSDAEWEARKREFNEIRALATGKVKPRSNAVRFKDSDMELFNADLYEDAVGGEIRKETFLKSPVGQMWLAAQEYKKANGSLDGFQAVLELSKGFDAHDEEGNRFTGQTLGIPTSLFENIKVIRRAEATKKIGKDGKEIDVPALDIMAGLPGYFGALNRLAMSGYGMGLDASLSDYDADRYNNLVGEYLESMRSDLYGKDGSSYRAAQRSRWGRSGYFEANKADPFAASGLLSQIGSNDALINVRDLHSMLRIKEKEAGQSEEDYLAELTAFRDDLAVNNERLFKNAKSDVAEENVKLRAMDTKGDKKALIEQIKALRENNIRGITLEDEWFQGKNGGLYALAMRNPLTGGRDLKHTRLFASKNGVTEGNAMLGTGLGWGINLDFDGDEFALMLPFFEKGLKGRTREEINALYGNEELLRKVQERRSEYIAKKFHLNEEKDENGNFGLKDQDVRIMADENAQTVAEFAAKANFAKTGVLDNFRQRMAYNLTDALLDEGGGNSEKSISSIITRRIFESISQDAISAKKVLDRYKSRGAGSEQGAYDMFVGELDQLVGGIYDGTMFSEKGDERRFIDRLTNMGIIDAKEGFNKRYSADLMSLIGSHKGMRKTFTEKYLKKKLSDDLYDTEKTTIEEFENALVKEVGENIFTPKVLKAAISDANFNLAEAVKNGKLKLYGRSGLAIGKAVTGSASMPGHELDARGGMISGGAGDGSGGSSSDPMTKASDTLLKAAEALLKVVEGFGGGSGGAGGSGGSDDGNGFVDYNRKISATRLAKLLRPSEYAGTMSNQFVDSVLGNLSKDNLGYNNEASLREGFKSWWTTARGTMVGNLAEMANDAENFGISMRDKNGNLIPVSEMIKRIDAYKPSKNAKQFNEWRGALRSAASSGNVKNFITKWNEFQQILGAVGDDRLARFVGASSGIENRSQAGINDYINEAIAGQDKQIDATLKAYKLRNGNVTGYTDLGTEVGLSAAVGRGYTFDAIFDTLKLIESEEKDASGKTHKHKAFATVDLKKLYGGTPREDQNIQMIAYQMVLDRLTDEVRGAWKEGKDDLESAYRSFSKTGMGKQLGWNKKQFARTKGLDSSALVAMSVLDENNVGSSFYTSATSAQKEFIKTEILNALQQGKPLDSLAMASISNTSLKGMGAGNFSIPEAVAQKQRELLMGDNEKGLATYWRQKIDLQVKRQQNNAMLDSGLASEAENEYLEKSNRLIAEQIDLLEKRYEELRKTAEAAGIPGDEFLEMNNRARKSTDAYSDEKYAEAGVNVEKFAAAKLKERKREYKSLIDRYNEMAVTYNKDKLASNKTNNTLEQRARQMRMDDLEEQMGDLHDAIMERRKGLSPEDAAAIEMQGSKKFDIKMDTLFIEGRGITNLWESLSVSFKNMMTRFTQMGLAYSILNKLKKSIAQIVQNSQQLDKVMTNLRIVTGYSREDARGLMNDYADLATQLASTTSEVASSAQEWLRQGYQVSEVNELVTSSIRLSVLGMMSASDATKALTSAMKGFKMEASQVNDIVDKFTTLDMSAATTAGDIATAVSQFAATAQMSGVDLDQAAAMATTIMDVSQKDAGATGNALKTMLSRFGNVKSGIFANMSEGDSDETTDKINDIERVLNTLGIQIRSSAREMRDFDDVLSDIAEKWDQLDRVSQNAIATALAGTRQRESFAVLMNNYDKYEKYLDISQNSEGTAEKKYESYIESLEASQKRLQAAWEDFANNSGVAEFLTKTNDILSGFVKDWLPAIFRWISKIFVTVKAYKLPVFAKAFFGLEGRGRAAWNGLSKKGFEAKATAAWTNPAEFLNPLEKKFAVSGAKGAFSGEPGKEGLEPAVQEATESLHGLAEAADSAATAEKEKKQATEEDTTKTQQHTGATEEDSNSEQLETKANIEAAKSEQAKSKGGFLTKAGLFTAGTNAAFSIMQGLTTKAQGLNWSSGETQDASGTANGVATAVSAVSSIGYLFGPGIGILANTLADVLNRFLIIPLIDREENERKWRVETATKLFESLGKLEENTSKLDNYIKKLDDQNQEELDKLISDLVEQIYSEEYDTKARRSLLSEVKNNLRDFGVDDSIVEGFDDIYDVLTYIKTANEDMREVLIQGFQLAVAEQKEDNRLATQEQKIKELEDKRRKFGTGSTENLIREYDIRQYGQRSSLDALEQQYQYYKQKGDAGMAQSTARRISEAQQLLATTEEALAILRDIHAEEKKIREEEDKQAALLALSSARTTVNGSTQFLTSLSLDYLKFLGKQGIYEIIAEELEKNGVDAYIGGRKENGLTAYAEDLIRQTIASDSNLNAVVTGNTYSLEDLLLGNRKYDWSNRREERDEIIKNFASALGISPSDLTRQLTNGSGEEYSKYWMLTLGDFTKSTSEVREELEKLISTFNSLSDGIASTAQGLEDIINTFPSLIKYIGDDEGLREHLMEAIVQKYNLYAESIFDQIMSSTEAGSTYKNDIYKNKGLTDEEVRLLQSSAFGDADSLQKISEFLQLGPTGIAKMMDVSKERAEEIYKILTTEFKDYFDELDIGKILGRQMADDVITPYLEARLDKELKALNEQKEALQQINKQREYENKLIEARNKLEEAGKEKKRVWREGVGWVYEANQEAMAEAQKNLNEVTNERAIRELDIQIEQVQATKDLIAAIKDDAKYEELKKDVEALIGSDASQTGVNGLIKAMEDLYGGNQGALIDLFGEDSPIVKAMNGLVDTMSGKAEGALERNYSNASLSQLSEWDQEGDSGAARELSSRGYYKDSRYSSENPVYSYDKGRAGEGAEGIENLKAAYESGLLSSEDQALVASELSRRGYELRNGEWTEKPRAFKFGGKSYTYDQNSELRSGNATYDHIQSDLEPGGSQNGYFYPEDELSSFSSTDANHEINGDKFQANYDNNLYNFLKNSPETATDGVLIGSEPGKKPGQDTFDAGYVHNRRLYPLRAAAMGSLSMPGGMSLVNELGTEAVVTPYGTVTALPSGTGVVPADITKNLWLLGETAPRILQLLDPRLGTKTLEGLGGGDSTMIQSMIINMNPDAGFDLDRFLSEVKAAVALKKNS